MDRVKRKRCSFAAGAAAARTDKERPARMIMDMTGLCALWSGPDPKKHRNDMNILMLGGMPGNEHRPLLTFNMRHFVSLSGGGADARKLEVIQLPDGEQVGSLRLYRRIVALKPMRDARPSRVTMLGDDPLSRVSPETPAEELEFHWMPCMSRVLRTKGVKVQSLYLGDDPGGVPEGEGTPDTKVLARFDVPQGFFYSSARVNELREPDVWDFIDGDEVTATQFIAETARCEIRDLPGPAAHVVLFPFGRRRRKQTLTLKAWHGAIRMSLTNLPPVDRLVPGEFPHFMAYYDILEDRPGSKPVPVRSGGGRRGVPPLGEDGNGSRVSPRGVRPIMCSPCCYP